MRRKTDDWVRKTRKEISRPRERKSVKIKEKKKREWKKWPSARKKKDRKRQAADRGKRRKEGVGGRQ